MCAYSKGPFAVVAKGNSGRLILKEIDLEDIGAKGFLGMVNFHIRQPIEPITAAIT